MTTMLEFLHAEAVGGGAWRFRIGPELHGAFGGAFGGAVAACAVVAARSVAPGRLVNALDMRFLRGLPAGDAHVAAEIVHCGRSLSTVAVEVTDDTGRPASRALVSLVAPEALERADHEGTRARWPTVDEGAAWRSPTGTTIPIVTTLAPRAVDLGADGIGTVVRVPWDDLGDSASAEAACLAADLCVGPPVGRAFPGRWIPHPNPDLSLRFAGPVRTPELLGVGRLERIVGGVALVRVEVVAGDAPVAIGVSSSLLLPPRS